MICSFWHILDFFFSEYKRYYNINKESIPPKIDIFAHKSGHWLNDVFTSWYSIKIVPSNPNIIGILNSQFLLNRMKIDEVNNPIISYLPILFI